MNSIRKLFLQFARRRVLLLSTRFTRITGFRIPLLWEFMLCRLGLYEVYKIVPIIVLQAYITVGSASTRWLPINN